MAQKHDILDYLKTGGTLTPLDALRRFGCFRLSSRIWDLKQDGHEIDVKTVTKDGKHFCEYKLIPAAQPSLFGGRV